ncbi:DUF2254 domain-containing protein [Jannaschia sp. Os4]|uniref:DUF2254 family protein n=1 Tax=Jannaschia sp. Os4 TaxID=2807617 RepID=UPI00193A7CB6|nr:DUF2254 family protein [Jannaschia sp. Os4]MBM2576972.1 DUF2254 domain-containing protein [Jannaschia sp. Os4]
MVRSSIRNVGSFVANRLLSGIWVPVLVAVVLGAGLATALGLADRAGASAWVAGWGGVFDFGPEAAGDAVAALLTVQTAVLSLYFSITLIVLTLAAQSLGSRLVERWIAQVETRLTLAAWAGLVAWSLVAGTFALPDGTAEDTPRLTVVTGIALTLAALAALGSAYHRLARTAHVDTSIAGIGRDLATDREDWGIVDGPSTALPPDGVLAAPRSGYLGGIERQRLIDAARDAGGRVAYIVAEGAFVLEGAAYAHVWGGTDALREAVADATTLSDYRADRPTGPFAITLLAEIGARALSPSVNDPLTAASCADWIGHGIARRLRCEAGPHGWFTDDRDAPRLAIPATGVLEQATPYLTVLHRAARGHPFVAARLAEAYRGAARSARHAADRDRLATLIEEAEAAGRAEGPTRLERLLLEPDAPGDARMADAPLAAE